MIRYTPDPSLTYIVGFSGGKDSTATWLHLTRELGLPDVVCTFADTGHEHQITHRYLDYLKGQGCNLVRVQPILEDMRGELKPEKIAQYNGAANSEKILGHAKNRRKR